MTVNPNIAFGQCIDGVWSAGQGKILNVTDPSNGVVLAHLASADAGAVDAAVAVARRAFQSWRTIPSAQRGALLRQVARGVEAASERLITLQMSNNGKPRGEAEFDVGDTIATWDYYADLCDGPAGAAGEDVVLPDPSFSARFVLEPCGVVGLIMPWNFPMVTTSWKLAPALAAGCTAVLKPSELTPLVEIELLKIIHQAGIPVGVVNMVCGTGADVGAVLSAHPGVDKVSFTGSTAVGRSVMRAASSDIKRISLELGGKSSLIVCEDADLDLALDLAAKGAFFNAGQMCSATSRVLVHRTLMSVFAGRLQALAETMRAGNEYGPLISDVQRQRVDALVRQGQEQGARLLVGGQIAGGPGFFYPPTVLVDLDNQNCLWRQEIFGPVACLRAFDDDDEAIALANDSEYGLVSTVVTASNARAHRFSAELAVGLVWINSHQVIFPQTAWGGFKQSGFGRELGPWGLRAFQEIKHVVSAGTMP